MTKLNKFFRSFQYNGLFLKWFWLVIEVLLSSFIGALIAFIFGDHYWAALVAFAIIILFLMIICAVVIVFENRVSVLSIMNQGLKDGRYEDVIKFGSAMSPTLFTSNKNDEIVMLGSKIDQAAEKIENAPYNKQKGDYKLTIGGIEKTITNIRVEILIDDMGWSNHLCHRNKDSIANIIAGMKKARIEANRLGRLITDETKRQKAIEPFVKLIMRGYRHLTGIFFTDATKQAQAIFFENITRVIMSNAEVLTQQGVCNNRSISLCAENVGGLFCVKNLRDKVECIRSNALSLFFPSTSKTTSLSTAILYSYLGSQEDVGNMSETDINDDIKLFNSMADNTKNSMIKEQCYAWSRNIVKQLLKRLDNPTNGHFISDDEIECRIAEALAFAEIYYYMRDSVPANNGRDSILSKGYIGKAELRYLSLLNEITLVDLRFPLTQQIFDSADIQERQKLHSLLDNLRRTRELCKGIRGDLYVRNSLHLIETLLIDFNYSYRYAMDIDKAARKKQLNTVQVEVKSIFDEIKAYEHKMDEEVENIFRRSMRELLEIKREVNQDFIVATKDKADMFVSNFEKLTEISYQNHYSQSSLSTKLCSYTDVQLSTIKERWRFS